VPLKLHCLIVRRLRARPAEANDHPMPWVGWLSLIECRLFILRRVARI